ncbi:MAG TPA: type VI secretion system ATPase TssH [Tepidisphaeraceae bacterium]|jgi:type VI secretion system protein VasG|nr:type VI secretion system ATPase TssH [Tepidisphaeraceae bacterium]
MAEISRAALFGKLNSLAYKAIESATVFCKMRGNPYVELVHWINQIMQLQDSDLHRIIRAFNVNPAKLATDLTAALDRLPRGATAITGLSPHLEEAVKEAWIYATLMFNEPSIRTGHLVVGMMRTQNLRNVLNGISMEFAKIKQEQLTDEFSKVTSGSVEEALAAKDGSTVGGNVSPGEHSGAIAPAQMGKQEALAKFSVDLTEKARKGEIDPIVGRDEEIRQVVDVLMRRRQNNPILTGEAGVGKTAVVEGFALRIVAGDVPPQLRDVTLRTLDVGLMQAGASMKGEFEQRLRSVIEEVQASPKPIILFIDEAHTLIGAGGSAGTGDAANLLKPALARGTLRTVAATTFDEYKKHIEKDPALVRRFQVVKVDEPTEEKALLMMRGIATPFEKHHKVQILDEALEAAVRLSHRYIPAAQLPDKAIKLIDTASARVAISQHAVPAEVDDSRRRIQALETEMEIVGRESNVGIDHKARTKELESKLSEERGRLQTLEENWGKEKDLVSQILEIRAKLRGAGQPIEHAKKGDAKAVEQKAAAAGAPAPESLSPEKKDALLADLQKLQTKLSDLQGEVPMIFPSVDAQAISSVVADWTGIPVGRMVKNEIESVLKLADTLESRIIGQRHALEAVAKRIQTSRAGMDNPARPIGVFMLVGPSGVGKTETALALAETLYGGEQNLITINMSEFQEAHTVSTLKGSPPGYVGYGEGGVLTEAVRRRPYSVVLLDEVEKAHPDVHEIFFQVFDKGHMEDGEGREIDFKNCVILLTSNVGSDLIMNMCKDPELAPQPEGIAKALREPLLKTFPAALLGRLVVVPYYPISDKMLQLIIKLQMKRIEKRLAANHKIPFTYDDAVLKLISSRTTETESGARAVDAILTHTVLPEISKTYLGRLAEGKAIKKVHISVADGNFAYAFD